MNRSASLLWRVLPLFVVAIVSFSLAGSLLAQEPSSSLRGTVRDRAGAPVAGASVAVSGEGGFRRETLSDAKGQYKIDSLPPGSYGVEVSRTAYSVAKQSVDVKGEPVTLDFAIERTGGEAAASRVSEQQLVGLPLNGRSYSQLATLQAGVADTSSQDASRGVGGGNLTVAGGRPSSNNFLLDGTNIMDTANQVPRSASGVQLGSEAVLQVQVFSGNYGAEYGRGSGGTLNSITRAGTNALHGTLFEYFRNSKMDARNFFDPGDNPPPFKRNQFGAIFAGPVKKDNTFFLGAFELMRDRLTLTETTFLPDANIRNGVVTNAAGAVLRTLPVNPRIRYYLDLYPLPNQGLIGSGVARNTSPVFLPTNDYYFSTRIDHKLTDRDSFFARYTFDDASSTSPQELYLFRTVSSSRQQYLTLVESHIFSVRAINAFRASYTRPVGVDDSTSSISVPKERYYVPGAPIFGQITIPGVAPIGPDYTQPDGKKLNSFQFADDVAIQMGAHALKIGGEFHRYRWDVFNSNSRGGVWAFNSLESFIQGGPESTELIVALPGSTNVKGFRQSLMGLYVQDNYRIGPQLSVNAGLRYEITSIITDHLGRTAILPDWEHETSLTQAPMLGKNPTLLNFSPRIGFSWAPRNSKTMLVGGGFGIYFDPMLEHMVDTQKNSAPYYKRVQNPNFDATSLFPDAVAAAALVPAGTSASGIAVLDYNHMHSPMLLRYNVGVQETLKGVAVKVYYVGARGNHLFRGYEVNLYPFPVQLPDGSLFFPPNSGPRNPAFGSITVTGADAQSFYNALQLTAAMSPKGGFSVQGNYTFSKSVDDSSIPNGTTSTVATREYPLFRTSDRGLSEFDIRHRLSVNYFYALPFGAKQRWMNSGVAAKALGGIRVGSVISFRTGIPFHPLLNVRRPGFLFNANRPNLVPGAHNNPTSGNSLGCAGIAAGEALGGPDRFYDPCAYSVPGPGLLGNVGRNTIDGPNVLGMDLSLQKDVALGGDKRLQFRAEFFNLPNHPSFANPPRGSQIVYSGASGRLNPTAGELVRTNVTSRQIQFALRLSF